MTARLFVTLLWFAGSCGAAAAHSPIKGIGTFYNGLLHPVLVPAHLLALAAIGLLIGQHAPRVSRLALPAFAAAAALILAIISQAPQLPPQWPLLVVALVAGLAVALSWSGGLALPALLAVAAGIFVAIDSAPDGVPPDRLWLALAGTGLGAVLVVTYFGGLAAWLGRPWQKIAVRAAGSWIAASAILVLTLELLSPAGAPP
jgi:urease accessory protein